MKYLELFEEVIATAAWVYHRTHTVKTIEAIREDGFRSGNGATYGRGIYATYDFGSQFMPYMKRYGEYVIRAKVNLYGFLIFDMDVAERVYGKHHLLPQQIKKCNMMLTREGSEKIWQIQDQIHNHPDAYTSTFAKQLFRSVRGARGLVYTGGNDGRCVVAYDPSAVIPYSYAHAPASDEPWDEGWTPPSPQRFTWTLIANPKRMRVQSDVEQAKADPESIENIHHPSVAAQLAAIDADPLLIGYIKRPAPEVIDRLVANGQITNVAHKLTPSHAKRLILADPSIASYVPDNNPVFQDPEVQEKILASVPDAGPGLRLGFMDTGLDDEDTPYDPRHLLFRLRNVPRLSERAVSMLLDKDIDANDFAHVLYKSASSVRDPEVMRKLLKVVPGAIKDMPQAPADLVHDTLASNLGLITLVSNPPVDLLWKAVQLKPVTALNVPFFRLPIDLIRWLADNHPRVVSELMKRHGLPKDVEAKVLAYRDRINQNMGR